MEYISNSNITSLSEDIDGNICAIENNFNFYKIKIIGPSHYQVVATLIVSIPILPETKINAIHFDLKNQLWIATQNRGIYKFAGRELTLFNQTKDYPTCLHK